MRTALLWLSLLLMASAATGCQSRYPADNADIVHELGATSHWLDGPPPKPMNDPAENPLQMFTGLHEKAGFQLFRTALPLFSNLGLLDALGAPDSAERDRTFTRIMDMIGTIYADPAYVDLGFDALEPVYQLSLPLLMTSSRGGYQVPYGHYYAFVPHDLDRSRPVDVVLFLHNYGPNLTAWITRLVIGTHRSLIVLSPTAGGSGNWQDPDNGTRALRAVHQMAETLKLNAYHLHAIGWSNGGAGVMQLALDHPGTFASVLVIASAWLDFQNLRTATPTDAQTRFTFICGEHDPLTTYATQAVDALRTHGFPVDVSVEPGQDHFLFIDQRCERVNRALRELAAPR
jgi:pimeloyl-ACP methyl ester carboxylesterase